MNVETRPITQAKKTIGSVFSFDIFLLLIVVALVIVGIVMVYSSSWNFAVWAGRDTSYLLSRQVLWLAVGTGAAVFASLFDYHRYKPFLLIMLVGTIGMLAAVLVFGEERFSATRTFIAGAGQPSEFAKLVVIIYLAFWLFNRREKINNIFFGLLPLAGILGLVSSFIALQPDLSAVITIMAIGAIMFFLIGADFRQILSVIILMAIAGSFIIFFSEKGRNRVNEYMAGLQDPVNTSYHIQHSMKAIAEGKIFGVGIGNGTVKYSLPVSWTDSIFAVIVEETGLVGAAVVILLYILLLWRGLYIASRAPDELGKLMAAGITLWIILEALINMGVLVNLIPSAGNALPLISAGGSNLVSVLLGLGILMNISRMTSKQKQEEESSRRYAGAVVDMRWRDGGRSLPRARRSANTRS